MYANAIKASGNSLRKLWDLAGNRRGKASHASSTPTLASVTTPNITGRDLWVRLRRMYIGHYRPSLKRKPKGHFEKRETDVP
jgi:hypothetical protein